MSAVVYGMLTSEFVRSILPRAVDRMGSNRTPCQIIVTFWCRPMTVLLGISVLRAVPKTLKCQDCYPSIPWIMAGELIAVGLFYLAAGLTARWSLFWTALVVNTDALMPGIPDVLFNLLVYVANPVILVTGFLYAFGRWDASGMPLVTRDYRLLSRDYRLPSSLHDEES